MTQKPTEEEIRRVKTWQEAQERVRRQEYEERNRRAAEEKRVKVYKGFAHKKIVDVEVDVRTTFAEVQQIRLAFDDGTAVIITPYGDGSGDNELELDWEE